MVNDFLKILQHKIYNNIIGVDSTEFKRLDFEKQFQSKFKKMKNEDAEYLDQHGVTLTINECYFMDIKQDEQQINAQHEAYNKGIEYMENNVDFIEDIINSYYETKVQLENEKVEYMNRHDFCTRILDNFKLTGKTYKH